MTEKATTRTKRPAKPAKAAKTAKKARKAKNTKNTRTNAATTARAGRGTSSDVKRPRATQPVPGRSPARTPSKGGPISPNPWRVTKSGTSLGTLFDHAWDAILVADRKRCIVDANPAACRLFEASRDQLLQMRLDNLRHVFSKSRYKQLLDGTLRPPVIRGEHFVRMRDGSQKTLDTIGARIDGNHALFVVRDVSQYRRLYQQIEMERKRLYDVLNGMNDPVVLVSPHFRIEFLNGTAREHFGECKGQLCHRALAGATRPCPDCKLPAVLSGKEERQVYEFRDKKGRWLEVSITPLLGPRGPAGGILAMRDISERKQVEEKIKASEEKFRSIIRHAGPGIVYVDLAGVHVDVNDAFCEMTGFSREELVGRGMPYPYWPKDQIPRFVRGMQNALEGGVNVAETVFVKKNGERLPVRIHPSLVRDHTGATVGEIGIFEDISSWETLQQELVYAQKMQTVGALAGGIVHEFNNLHCGMRLVIESVLAEIGHPLPIRKDLEAVLERLERANSITGQLKTFSQKMPSQKVRTSLSGVIEEALRFAAATLNKDKISVEFDRSRDVPELVLDRVQMAQAILNLILNAGDAMESSEVRRLRIETGVKEGRAFVRLSDTGSGIAEEYLDSIFDPFFTTKENRGEQVRSGFGLGLTVSEAITKDHGGTIDVSSTVGTGSTFTVWLPLETPSMVSRVSPPVELYTRVKGKRVLITENDSVLRTLLDNALRRAGCVVETTESVDQSVRLLGSRRYDIAVVDLELPDGRAEDILGAIEKGTPADRPATIVVTGRTPATGRKKPVRPGAEAILYKPVTLDSLYTAVDMAIGKREKGLGA
jgi:PAS domain S-box-containing protein